MIFQIARYVLLTFAIAAMGPADAQAQLSEDGRALIVSGVTGEQFNAALEDFLQNGAQGETIVTLARNGHPTAIRTLAQECLYNDVCPVSRKEAHDMLAEHARTDGNSASDLGVIYHWGKYGQADDVLAARWLGYAHTLGGANALLFLGNLDAAAVEKAGLSHLLTPASPAPHAAPSGPTVFRWPGHTGFPVFADTAMSDDADAAMSCHLVLGAKFDSEAARFSGGQSISEVQLFMLESLNRSAEYALDWAGDPLSNGGISGAALDQAVAAHAAQMRRDPSSGPTADFCEQNLALFQAELMLDQ